MNNPSLEELQQRIRQLEQENRTLKETTPAKGRLSLKVSPKGGVSLYGLGKFPVTLYKEQWERLLDYGDEIRKFLQEHQSELKLKQ